MKIRSPRLRYAWASAALAVTAGLGVLAAPQAGAATPWQAGAPLASGAATTVATYNGLTAAQRANLLNVARDTWKFYTADVDQATSLPMDNLTFAGGSAAPTTYGRYTSASNIGVYLWAVVSARDLGLITERQADARVAATLTEVSHLQRYDGFLYQWYDTANGQVLTNPGAADCPAGAAPAFNNCFFVSNVDNGWYASGLIVVAQAMPELKPLADRLRAELETKGRLGWHQECCARLIVDCSQGRSPDRDLVWRIKGSHKLGRASLAVLREIWQWREGEAIAANRPPYAAWESVHC